jgi:hypothetical protein
MSAYDIEWSAKTAGGSGVILGLACTPAADGATYVPSTAANRATSGRKGGICVSPPTPDGIFALQYTGEVSATVTGLGAGTKSLVRANNATGVLERVGSPSPDDELWGHCDALGNLSLDYTLNAAASVTQLTQDVIAGPGAGSLPSTVVQVTGPGGGGGTLPVLAAVIQFDKGVAGPAIVQADPTAAVDGQPTALLAQNGHGASKKGGALGLNAGNGGVGGAGATGGSATLSAGNAGTGGVSNGGNASLLAGGDSSTGGSGGTALVQGGSGLNGGFAQLVGGAAVGAAADAGNAQVQGGAGGSGNGSFGGAAFIQGGGGGTGSGSVGGPVSMTAGGPGSGGGNSPGAAATVAAGAAAGIAAGGSALVSSGAGSGGGVAGDVELKLGANTGHLKLTNMPTQAAVGAINTYLEVNLNGVLLRIPCYNPP